MHKYTEHIVEGQWTLQDWTLQLEGICFFGLLLHCEGLSKVDDVGGPNGKGEEQKSLV